MSVSLSVCLSALNGSHSTGRIFIKFYMAVFFRKSVEKKIQVCAKSEKNNWLLVMNTYVVGSKSFRPDIKKPRQMENAVRDI